MCSRKSVLLPLPWLIKDEKSVTWADVLGHQDLWCGASLIICFERVPELKSTGEKKNPVLDYYVRLTITMQG
jgi:hypothetical protein